MNNDFKALSNMSITELKQLLSCVNQDLKSIKKQKRREKIAKINNEISEGVLCNNIAKSFTGNKAVPPSDNNKLKADIAIQTDILDYLNNGGHIITAKRRNKVKCQTFRNNKYSIANQGHQASITGKYGFFASPNKVTL